MHRPATPSSSMHAQLHHNTHPRWRPAQPVQRPDVAAGGSQLHALHSRARGRQQGWQQGRQQGPARPDPDLDRDTNRIGAQPARPQQPPQPFPRLHVHVPDVDANELHPLHNGKSCLRGTSSEIRQAASRSLDEALAYRRASPRPAGADQFLWRSRRRLVRETERQPAAAALPVLAGRGQPDARGAGDGEDQLDGHRQGRTGLPARPPRRVSLSPYTPLRDSGLGSECTDPELLFSAGTPVAARVDAVAAISGGCDSSSGSSAGGSRRSVVARDCRHCRLHRDHSPPSGGRTSTSTPRPPPPRPRRHPRPPSRRRVQRPSQAPMGSGRASMRAG